MFWNMEYLPNFAFFKHLVSTLAWATTASAVVEGEVVVVHTLPSPIKRT